MTKLSGWEQRLATLYDVSEIFSSMQGEGLNAGTPSAFIRLAGCNLRCDWCDTKYSWGEGKRMTLASILEHKAVKDNTHIVITGGEPLMQDIQPMVLTLLHEGKRMEVESNATMKNDWILGYALLTLSPKRHHVVPEVIQRYSHSAVYKFVIGNEDDLNFAYETSKTYNLQKVYLQPEGTTREAVLKNLEYIANELTGRPTARHYHDWEVCVSPRLHTLVWGNTRGR